MLWEANGRFFSSLQLIILNSSFMIHFFDAHSHIQMKEFDKDRDAVLSRMRDEGVGAIVVGVDLESSRAAVALAEKHDFLWATVGLHPHDNLEEVFDAEAYRALARHPKTVAIGECGLDYFKLQNSDFKLKEEQKKRFEEQLKLTAEVKKPLMLHIRDNPGQHGAYEDVLKILNLQFEILNLKLKGNVHFFAGTSDIAKQFFGLGFTISFTGVITFASQYDTVIKDAPLQNILSETDCPFVAPVPHRGERNEPVYVKEVVKRIAAIRGENEAAVATALAQNAKRVFGL